MLNNYKFTRENIVKQITSFDEATQDGHYWFPLFDEINEEKGENLDDYFYPREMFKHKMYFTKEDIRLYLSKRKERINMDVKYRKALRFYETNKELKRFNVKDIVPPNEFTVGELIDAFEYIVY